MCVTLKTQTCRRRRPPYQRANTALGMVPSFPDYSQGIGDLGLDGGDGRSASDKAEEKKKKLDLLLLFSLREEEVILG